LNFELGTSCKLAPAGTGRTGETCGTCETGGTGETGERILNWAQAASLRQRGIGEIEKTKNKKAQHS